MSSALFYTPVATHRSLCGVPWPRCWHVWGHYSLGSVFLIFTGGGQALKGESPLFINNRWLSLGAVTQLSGDFQSCLLRITSCPGG